MIASVTAGGLAMPKLGLGTFRMIGAACTEAVQRALHLGYRHIDIHWPAPDMNLAQALETLVALQEAGLARRIGVSNFPVALLRQAVEEIRAPITCNQVEYHVLLDQSAVLNYAHAHGLAVTVYCPLGRGGLAEEPALAATATKHGVSPAHVALRWLLDQNDVAAIPKAQRESSQRANLEALSVTLDDDDRKALSALPKTQRLVNPSFAPSWDR